MMWMMRMMKCLVVELPEKHVVGDVVVVVGGVAAVGSAAVVVGYFVGAAVVVIRVAHYQSHSAGHDFAMAVG